MVAPHPRGSSDFFQKDKKKPLEFTVKNLRPKKQDDEKAQVEFRKTLNTALKVLNASEVEPAEHTDSDK